MKPFMYAIADKYGEAYIDENCVANSPSQFDEDDLNDHERQVVPVYTGPQIEQMQERIDSLVRERDEAVALLRQLAEATRDEEIPSDQARIFLAKIDGKETI